MTESKDSMKVNARVALVSCWPGVPEQHGRIVRPMKNELPLPSADWRIVKFDDDGARLCVHVESMRGMS
jgi:hypothetical protein